MLNPTPNPNPSKPAVIKEKTAKEGWENEGGAMRDGPSTQGPAVMKQVVLPADPASPEAAAIDAVQDVLMNVESSDGAPPPRGWRLAGWHWLAVVVPALLALGGAVWVAAAFGVVAALFGLVLLGVLGAAAAPVWGAGLLRGKEERAARVEAAVVVGVQGVGTGRGVIAPARRTDVGGSGL